MEQTGPDSDPEAAMVLTCVTPYVPHEGIDHAGGVFLQLYLTAALERGWQVHLLAPDTGANRRAVARATRGLDVRLLRGTDGTATRLRNVVVDGVPATSGRRWVRRLGREGVDLLRSSDVIVLQWADAMWNAPAVRRLAPGVPVVGVAHDVRTESLSRARGEAHGRARLEALLGLRAARQREVLALNACQTVGVFKQEDERLLRDAGVTARLTLLPILTSGTDGIAGPEPASRRLLFVSAFHRPENVEAAEWFLDDVLPAVQREVPEVVLRLAGSRPPHRLLRRVSPQVEVTGYLPRLADAYADVAVVVVPVRRGAGVKVKTVEAVRAGYPVVTTTVGAEGVAAAAHVGGALRMAVRDDPGAFARAVIELLESEEPLARGSAPSAPVLLRDHFAELTSLAAAGAAGR